MKVFKDLGSATQLGVAHGPGIIEFIESNPGYADYLEVPLELLRHSPELGQIQSVAPIVLHCASLSIAGFVPPSETTIEAVQVEASRTQTPWIGEHLAFVSADGINEEADRDSAPTNLTYTLCPQLSDETVDRVVENIAALKARFSVPLILENSPQYFAVPGSTMCMVDFIARVLDRCEVGLLLDLSHLMITAANTGTDPFRDIERLPLERVIEIHVSGLREQSGVVWDDHAVPAPPDMFKLLGRVLERSKPRALTVEYNWSALPPQILVDHLRRLRYAIGRE